MQVVILAGGLGTRIAEETDYIPKPMVQVGDRPILWHIIKYFTSFSFCNFIICTGYKSKIIKNYFNNQKNLKSLSLKRNNIKLIFTGNLSNTGERIYRIKKYIHNDFLMTYGDGLANVNLDDLVNFHKKNNLIATVTAVKPPPRFGTLDIKKNMVKNFYEKNLKNENWINGGFFVLKKKIFNFFRKKNSIFESHILNAVVKKKQLCAYKHFNFWQPMDTLKEKRLLNDLWDQNKAPWKIWNE